MQERRNYSALAMELRLSCTNPSICIFLNISLSIYIYVNSHLQEQADKKLSASKLKQQTPKEDKDGDGEGPSNEDDKMMELSGERVPTQGVARGPETSIHTQLEHLQITVSVFKKCFLRIEVVCLPVKPLIWVAPNPKI